LGFARHPAAKSECTFAEYAPKTLILGVLDLAMIGIVNGRSCPPPPFSARPIKGP
jgi:hypothetical protein